ncbi:MAG TPA: methyltransferase domain-containing protein, partial [Planctomycetota bacterium]|nr:methyltransferase domain-containing protein [Planctomycetota bacterium]
GVRQLRIIDVGPGDGFAMEEFIARGATKVVGLETDQNKVKRLRARGLEVQPGDGGFPLHSFDLVWCHHVLEHQNGSREFLDVLRTLMAPHGRLWITVPNMAGVDVFSPGHILNFNAPTLVEHLRRAGFDVENCSIWADGGQLRVRARLWGQEGLSPYPKPMADALKAVGRCPAKVLELVNWEI